MNFKGGLLLLGMATAVVLVILNPFRGPDRAVRPSDDPSDDRPLAAPGPPAPIDETTGPAMRDAVADPSALPAPASDDPAALRGVIVDAATGTPVPNASVEAMSAAFEPGIVSRPRRPAGAAPVAWNRIPAARSTTDPTGRFSIPWSPDHPADLRIVASGYLDELRSSVTAGEPLRISLRAGRPIRGRVHRGDGVGVEGAVVRAETVPRDAVGRGTRVTSAARTDAQGAFEVLGLPEVTSMIVVTHADYMPASFRTTPEAAPPYVALIPALRGWIRTHSSDGSASSAPVVQWSRTGATGGALGVGVVDLSVGEPDPDTDRSVSGRTAREGYGPVKVPCVPSDGVVRFTVRVLGYLPWTSEDLPVPAGGGERTLDATLERDPAVGSISARLRDAEGRDIPFQSGEQLMVMRRTDGPAFVGRVVVRDGGVLFDGLPAGTYELAAADRKLGGATAIVAVEGGRSTPAEVRFSAPTSLRVRADVGAKRRVHFQLLRAGVAVAAFEDPPPKDEVDPDKSPTHFFAGTEGTLLLGLGAGRYAVHVLSPDLVAADVEIELRPGAPAEVEIHARPR